MNRSESWYRQVVTERRGTFRGMELEMPLREAIANETGELSRGRNSVSVRTELDSDSWSETEVGFTRRHGLDRIVTVRFSLVTQAHFADAEATFELVCSHFSRAFGPPAPAAASEQRGGRAQKRWDVQGRELPTALSVRFLDGMNGDMVRSASVVVEMERAHA